LIHVFPKHFHHIRHYGLLANGHRADNVALARRLLTAQNHNLRANDDAGKTTDDKKIVEPSCPVCGGPMIIIEIFEPGAEPTAHHQRAPPEQRILPS